MANKLLLPLLLLVVQPWRAVALRSSMECIRWAKEGECSRNPRYLWAHCLAACMELSRDDHDLCPRWALDGECSKNPAYVHIHCPQSCGRAIGWSPVTRKILDIAFIPIEPIFLLQHECLDYNEMFIAALALQNRLKHMFDASVFDGISLTAPNDFLMNYGLVEAILYSMRLYDTVIKSFDDDALNEKSDEAIRFVLSKISYDGDAIGRFIPQMYFSLESVRMSIIHKVGDMQKQQQQIMQKYHGLKDTYLRDNFANVKENACSILLDQNLSNILDLYLSAPIRVHNNEHSDIEYLSTLDDNEDGDDDQAVADSGNFEISKELKMKLQDIVKNKGDHAIHDSDIPSDNCHNSDGTLVKPEICFMINKQKLIMERARELQGQFKDAKQLSVNIRPTRIVQPYMTLLNGAKMPALGLGTWELSGLECEATVYDAIKMGYRHIDTSQAYGNEGDIGRAIKRAIDEGIVSRNDLFISTKISFQKDSGRNVFNLVHLQLERLKLNYIDLYLIHSHIGSENILRSTWHSITQMYYDGIIRAAGVSNFNAEQLKDLISMVLKSREEVADDQIDSLLFPMVLQNKFDIYHTGKQLDHRGDDIQSLCSHYGIKIVGYSPLSPFPFVLVPLKDPIIGMISKKRNVSPAEVILHWTLQQNVAVIPRSSNRTHLRDNLLAASKLAISSAGLTDDEMFILSSISSLVSTPFSVKSYGFDS